jgi:hypothetical protein
MDGSVARNPSRLGEEDLERGLARAARILAG